MSLKLSQAIAGFIRYKSAIGRSPHTLRNYRVTLDKLQLYLEAVHGDPDPPIDQITRARLVGFFAWLQEDYVATPDGAAPRGQIRLSPKSIRNVHTDLSALWTWLVQEALVENHIVRAIDAPRANPPVIVPLTREEVTALLKACDHSRTWKTRAQTAHSRPTAVRDRLIVLLLLDTGLRASELCHLRLADLDLSHNRITVTGKGDKQRLVHFGQRTGKHLWRYLIPRLDEMPPDQSLLLVGPPDDPRPMNRHVLRKLLHRIGRRASVANVHPHRFRHTFAITYLRNGGDLLTLQALLGHSDLAMVRRYARVVAADLESAHRRASPVDNWRL